MPCPCKHRAPPDSIFMKAGNILSYTKNQKNKQQIPQATGQKKKLATKHFRGKKSQIIRLLLIVANYPRNIESSQ